jgi:hypothetical protein
MSRKWGLFFSLSKKTLHRRLSRMASLVNILVNKCNSVNHGNPREMLSDGGPIHLVACKDFEGTSISTTKPYG